VPTISHSGPQSRRIVLDRDAFAAALRAFRAALGEAHVRDLPEDLDRIAKATVPAPRRPSAVVYPGTAEEVAEVVKIASRHGVPLWPVSRGKNWGYGSATPAFDDTVVVVLERLNRILEVDEQLAYAVIEPGVTYRQLRAHLDARHPTLWCDSTDGPPDGSVIGNALDRGLGVTHYADHFGSLCGLEVVLPGGEVIRTGGGPPSCKTWNTHKWGVGPYLEGLFSQSSFGVVVKAGVWLMPKPEAFCSFTFDLARPEDLPRLVDAIRDLALSGVLNAACHLINEVVTLAVLWQYPPSLLDRHSRLPAETVASRCRELGVAPWTLGGGIQGTAAQVRAVKKALRARLAPLGGLMFVSDRLVAAVELLNGLMRRGGAGRAVAALVRAATGKSPELLDAAPHIHSVLKGIPSDYFVRHAYFKSRVPKPEIADPDRDDVGLIWFAPIAPMTGKNVAEVLALCRPLFERYEFDFYAALLMQNARSMIVLMSIFYMKDSLEQTARAGRLYDELGDVTKRAGYQQYRVGVRGMPGLADTAPAFIDLVRALKSGIDPRSILAPGKYGA
jgi:4-cresol dehydrogenase (hydroxylating)